MELGTAAVQFQFLKAGPRAVLLVVSSLRELSMRCLWLSRPICTARIASRRRMSTSWAADRPEAVNLYP